MSNFLRKTKAIHHRHQSRSDDLQAEQEKQKFWNQLEETREDVDKLSMEVLEERAEAEALETQLVSELNFSIEQIEVANRLKGRLASAENEKTKTTITLLENMHIEVQEHELEIDVWNRNEERMLEQLEATNKRVIELEDEVQHWRTGHNLFVPTELDSEEDTYTADDDNLKEEEYNLFVL
ncbi:hypothetical protein CAEBREN_04133 [Caenorhabditis brenneri]|uniref:Uncharacterized protein n=1 Tax=Caenorhabditis brenneri TaxID=135651 RepID=G0NJY1_CAEBE|nr:hypothetical protein CAEBREN_04133 [Caenorhabditis brenneri]